MTMTIREILRGCEVGRIQTVGSMQVIPLIMEENLQDNRFATPDIVRVGTSDYGTMNFTNPEGKPVLLPTNAGYVVKQAAQDHAMTTAAIVPGKSRRSFDDAMCIQANQGGTIAEGEHKLLILPLALRRPALEMRGKRSYNKLWQSIGELSASNQLGGDRNLVTYLQSYERQLDEFIAEFEVVDDQVGAIILINGNVVGVERAPSAVYWKTIWEPLIRVCYGSAAIAASKVTLKAKDLLKTRVPLEVVDLSTMESLCAALEAADAKQDDLAKQQVRDLLEDTFDEAKVETKEKTSLKTLKNDQFFGQVAVDQTSEKVLYVSLVVNEGWDEKRGWRLAKSFDL